MADTLKNFPELSDLGTHREDVYYTFEDGVDIYTIKKGPAQKVYSVESGSTTYVQGTDYDFTLTADGDVLEIDWGIGGSSPDDGDTFVVDQQHESVLSRYTRSHDVTFEELEQDYEDIVEIRQIDNTRTDDQLDRIGAFFGPLGNRVNRDNTEYRTYLKSIINSFRGRGTVDGLLFAVSSALDVDQSDIELEELFETLEYDIVIKNWTKHSVSTVEDIANLADPSVVRLRQTAYQVEDGHQSEEFAVLDDEGIAQNALWDNAPEDRWDYTEWQGSFSTESYTVTDGVLGEDLVTITESAASTNTLTWNDAEWGAKDWTGHADVSFNTYGSMTYGSDEWS